MIVENKNEITFEEFSAWMVGMIRGKGGAIPDLDDWKEIKKMMDKVAPTKENVAAPIFPDYPYNPPQPFSPPFVPWADNTGTPPWAPGTIICDNQTSNEIKLNTNGTVTTTTAKEGDEPMYIDARQPGWGQVTSGFVQVDASKSEYGMAEAILSMESLSKQIGAGEQ